MSSQEIETWVSDKLHDILGISDKYISLYLIELGTKSHSSQDFVNRIQDTNTIDVDSNVIRFCTELWNKVGALKKTISFAIISYLKVFVSVFLCRGA